MKIINAKKDWDKILTNYFKDLSDVYFEYEYFDFYAKYFKTQIEGIFWEDENVTIFWTHLIRNINNIDIFKDYNFYDLTPPYGSGGPLTLVKTNNEEKVRKSVSSFFKAYIDYSIKQDYVCEYISFHPLLDNWKLYQDLFSIMYSNDIIVLDLTQNYEEIWSQMEKNTRYYTKKALKEFSDIIVVEKPSDEVIQEFLTIFYETMDKNKAAERYYVPFDFIKGQFNINAIMIYCNSVDGILASSAIFLKGTHFMHYHLSATNYIFKSSPSRAVLWKAIEYAKENGLQWFHFGGGAWKNDSLFQFKKGFSRTFRKYYRGRIIFNNKLYDELCSLNKLSKENPDIFPQYRAGYQKKLI